MQIKHSYRRKIIKHCEKGQMFQVLNSSVQLILLVEMHKTCSLAPLPLPTHQMIVRACTVAQRSFWEVGFLGAAAVLCWIKRQPQGIGKCVELGALVSAFCVKLAADSVARFTLRNAFKCLVRPELLCSDSFEVTRATTPLEHQRWN